MAHPFAFVCPFARRLPPLPNDFRAVPFPIHVLSYHVYCNHNHICLCFYSYSQISSRRSFTRARMMHTGMRSRRSLRSNPMIGSHRFVGFDRQILCRRHLFIPFSLLPWMLHSEYSVINLEYSMLEADRCICTAAFPH